MVKKHKIVAGLFLIGIATLFSSCNGAETKSAKNYYKEGEKFLEAENYSEAEKQFAKALEKKKDKAEYYIMHGMSLIKIGKLQEAQEEFDKAILDKNNQIVRENNKQAYRGKGIAYLEEGNPQAALDYFGKAEEIKNLSEWNEDILLYKAEAQIQCEAFSDAIQTYEKIMATTKNKVDIYLKLGNVYQLMEEYEKASNCYKEAKGLDSKEPKIYLEEYFMLIKQGDETAAQDTLKAALDIKAKNQEANFYLALIAYYLGDMQKAVDSLSAMTTEGYVMAYYYLGEIYFDKKDYENAVFNYEKYIEMDKNINSAEAYYTAAVCYVKTKYYEKAVDVLQRGLELKDNNYTQKLQKSLVAVYEKMTCFKEALEIANEYQAMYPDDKAMKKEVKFLKSRIETPKSQENKTDNAVE